MKQELDTIILADPLITVSHCHSATIHPGPSHVFPCVCESMTESLSECTMLVSAAVEGAEGAGVEMSELLLPSPRGSPQTIEECGLGRRRTSL